ncbi:Uncharacterized protein Fot_30874 [Forsythia ovata]|uniref:Uncharacterized protein n=1 Tax=Forsythia ovata TaxID=205694 RepID=A0ABD1T3I5_9LAMI
MLKPISKNQKPITPIPTENAENAAPHTDSPLAANHLRWNRLPPRIKGIKGAEEEEQLVQEIQGPEDKDAVFNTIHLLLRTMIQPSSTGKSVLQPNKIQRGQSLIVCQRLRVPYSRLLEGYSLCEISFPRVH